MFAVCQFTQNFADHAVPWDLSLQPHTNTAISHKHNFFHSWSVEYALILIVKSALEMYFFIISILCLNQLSINNEISSHSTHVWTCNAWQRSTAIISESSIMSFYLGSTQDSLSFNFIHLHCVPKKWHQNSNHYNYGISYQN